MQGSSSTGMTSLCIHHVSQEDIADPTGKLALRIAEFLQRTAHSSTRRALSPTLLLLPASLSFNSFSAIQLGNGLYCTGNQAGRVPAALWYDLPKCRILYSPACTSLRSFRTIANTRHARV